MNTNLMPHESRMFPWLPMNPLASMREEMDQMFRGFGEGKGWLEPRFSPAMNVTETEKAVEVRADLPGMKPEEIDIQVHGNVLTIAGERQEEKEEKGKTFHRVERRYGRFEREVTLPAEVNEEKIEAQYREGVLTVVLPKVETSTPRKIAVKT